MTEIALPPPSPRDAEVQEVVLRLVEAFAFREAHAVLAARLREIRAQELTEIQKVYLEWDRLPKETRPDFLTYAHHRRHPQIEKE